MPEILRVRANSTIQKVIDIVDASSAVRIELEHGSAADIVIHIHGDAPTMDHAADVTVGPEARCTVLTINDAGATSSVSIKQQGSIADGGSLRWQNITLGGGDMTHDLTSHAVGNDAESAVEQKLGDGCRKHFGLFFGAVVVWRKINGVLVNVA